mmetsp:Transcript_26442/g.49140  ORF Transcript_26442/g.49140 Transcript_26442/m.49140 type:complete len:125 (-) Transcript_26442:6-380(-)
MPTFLKVKNPARQKKKKICVFENHPPRTCEASKGGPYDVSYVTPKMTCANLDVRGASFRQQPSFDVGSIKSSYGGKPSSSIQIRSYLQNTLEKNQSLGKTGYSLEDMYTRKIAYHRIHGQQSLH